MQQTLTLIIILFLIKASLSNKCDSFEDVEVTAQPEQEDSYKTRVNGCIERVAFEKVISQIYIRHQKIPKLGIDSVRNMKHLINIQFYRCQINTIEPGALRNVPNLRSIQIVSNEIINIPKGVFSLVPSVEILKLNSNVIETIENEAFANLPTLKKLYLKNNQLSNWDREWFMNTTSLQLVDFQYNKIKILPKQAFLNLQNLKEIYFDYNELKSIQFEAFKGLKRLDYLGLSYNRLRTIDNKVFPNEVVIKSMTIDANYLNYLPKGVLTRVRVKEMSITGNPWKCSCLDQILFWLYEMNATVISSDSCKRVDVPVCSFPSSFSRTCIETVDEEVTRIYLEELKQIEPPLDKYCARLD